MIKNEMSIVYLMSHYAASHMPQLIDCEISTVDINLNKSLTHFNMPRNFQELSDTELMQEIETAQMDEREGNKQHGSW